MYVLTYLVAIVISNLSVAYFGPPSVIVNAFLFIGLDLTVRDSLHDLWHTHMKRNMGLLILSGSILSFLVNHASLRIAVASFIAFGVSEFVKTLLYHIMRARRRMDRVNVANVGASSFDSILFPTIAFGVFIPYAIIGQFIAKIVGGYLWTIVLNRKVRKHTPTAG